VVERHGHHFLERVFTSQELGEVGDKIISLSARFAAKEAVSKALGTGIGSLTWHEIEILRGPSNAPNLHLTGNAHRIATEKGLTHWSLSISHTHTHAIAMVIATGE
jgi:holo-[acyl-carrier protein] synthase